MKRISILCIALLGGIISMSSCTKRESGVCYCSYFSGDKTQYDLSDLTRTQQIDSCYVLSQHASAFAGSCELE